MEVLAAGNANTIYIHPQGLLRVSKSDRDPKEIIEYFSMWEKRMPRYIGSMELVNDPIYGRSILMEHIGKNNTLLVEFKPKWLIQSPDAPENARACRTCAIDTLRNKNRTWCPLRLLQRQDLAEMLVNLNSKHPEAVAKFLESTDLLDLLAKYQHGPSVFANPTPEFLDAMSARDCTILIEGSHEKPESLEDWSNVEGVWMRARLVDLDPKSPDQMEKWRSIETSITSLYNEGVPGCYKY